MSMTLFPHFLLRSPDKTELWDSPGQCRDKNGENNWPDGRPDVYFLTCIDKIAAAKWPRSRGLGEVHASKSRDASRRGWSF
jgi:hypothetical protein